MLSIFYKASLVPISIGYKVDSFTILKALLNGQLAHLGETAGYISQDKQLKNVKYIKIAIQIEIYKVYPNY